ncbi:MAG: TetR/AcrR family transcriptional regulator [Actinomycetota bacterium]|nr:TetR/AcrR family transcriptional regulator [Actinomycetota bacterium]
MPRVSAEHRTARREQILRAAWRCVAREGFHKASMADVIAESGLSAGAVYGYFRSKNEIIIALADRSIGTVDEVFHRMLADGRSPHPAEVLEAALQRLLQSAVGEDGDLTLIAVQAWGEAVRGGEIHDLVRPRITELREHWVEIARRHQAAGGLRPDADPEQVGRALLGLMPGFVLQRLLLGEVTPAGYAAGVRAMLDS